MFDSMGMMIRCLVVFVIGSTLARQYVPVRARATTETLFVTKTEIKTETVSACETTVTIQDCMSTITIQGEVQTVTVTKLSSQPTKEPEPIEIEQDNFITFGQFSRAVSFYNLTSAGGFPPEPSWAIYQGYLDHIVPEMDLVEQAMLLANLIWESAGFQYHEEIACKGVSTSTTRCPYGLYHGRGYMQLSWDYNYKAASRYIFGDDRLLMVPDLVLQDDIAWQTALWYWKTHVRPRLFENGAITSRSIGYAVRAINGAQECAIPQMQRNNLRLHPKINHQAAVNRLAIFNALLGDWRLVHRPEDFGSLEGCLSVKTNPEIQYELEKADRRRHQLVRT